jgi:predicted RNase H-like nuclease
VNESTFIGVDLAWRGGNRRSGVAVLKGDRHKAELTEVEVLSSFEEIIAFINRHSIETTFVAVDAPLVIVNEREQRKCENEISRRYGSFGASCHSSNLSLYPNADSVRLTSALRSRGFVHAPLAKPENQRVMLEVYPHPALLELFDLCSILKYKKGKVAERRTGQRELQDKIRELSHFAPPLESNSRLAEFLATDLNSLKGRKLKDNEDKLDAIVCAYIAYHFFVFGASRTRLFGDVTSGYLMVPIRSEDTGLSVI